ncbi:protein-tyrosine phosphatase [Brevibacterium siliguriense]|uniref:protein-tyrosine-phosphatase n=1 Tax=Brevibacterium siliguriense TaxID=1136497 RepID=A0A1H1LFL3_9MICO|nr:low molecular weight protein-tyrosine-phosphatase [Brevibacterium siliguriense]SDR73207.1 protein-tyrosine phosphatase [Brevibacterium siliguriense]
MSLASVVFVCTGNICRSVTAERVLLHHLADTGAEAVVDSAGISDEEAGNPIDPRQARVLASAGYRTDDHVARQITPAWLAERDLAVAMTARHYRALERMIAGLPAEAAPELRMLREFDPRVVGANEGAGADGTSAAPGRAGAASARDDIPAPDVEDPWYGEFKDFEETLETIEVSVPGITDRLRALAAKTQ